jgi:hypothetical protein
MPQHFTKVDENFTCDHCGTQVTGTGYTNHCPHCLYSKHVDNQTPGDRQSQCQDLMKPIGVEVKSGKYIIHHRCQTCQTIKKNQASPQDNQELLIKLSSQPLSIKK